MAHIQASYVPVAGLFQGCQNVVFLGLHSVFWSGCTIGWILIFFWLSIFVNEKIVMACRNPAA